jgi:hypothetical protein
VTEGELHGARMAFERILVRPTPADLWLLQKELLVIGGDHAARARVVARSFHACLRTLESKSASRTDSRWGAALGTAAVASVSLGDASEGRDDPLTRLLRTGVPAMLELGSAFKTEQAWEVEAGLVYDEFAWFLYDELWDVSLAARPGFSAAERRDQIALLLDPLLDTSVTDGDRAALVVHVFQAVLTARLVPLFEDLG